MKVALIRSDHRAMGDAGRCGVAGRSVEIRRDLGRLRTPREMSFSIADESRLRYPLEATACSARAIV